MHRFHNTISHNTVNAVDTGSQVCNLAWSANVNELVSSHGYSQNAIVVWRYPNLCKVATLTGHLSRVLYLSLSPDGKTIVTGAGACLSSCAPVLLLNVCPFPQCVCVCVCVSVCVCV